MENMLESFPFDSSPDVQYDEWGYPRFDRAVGSRCLRDALRKLFTSGVFPSPGNALQISKADGLAVSIAPGACIVDGAIGTVLEPMRVTLADAPPKGSVCYGLMLRADVSQDARAVFVRVAASEPGPAPEPPEPTTGPEHVEIRLGHVTVPNGASDLAGAKVVNEKGLAACPYAAPFDRIDASAILEDFRAQGAEAYEALMRQLNAYFEFVASAIDGTTAGHLQNQITSIRDEMFSVANLDKKYFSVSEGVKPVVGIAPDAVGTANIEDGAVTAAKLAAGSLDGGMSEDGTIGIFQILTTKTMVDLGFKKKEPEGYDAKRFAHTEKTKTNEYFLALDDDWFPAAINVNGKPVVMMTTIDHSAKKIFVKSRVFSDDGASVNNETELVADTTGYADFESHAQKVTVDASGVHYDGVLKYWSKSENTDYAIAFRATVNNDGVASIPRKNTTPIKYPSPTYSKDYDYCFPFEKAAIVEDGSLISISGRCNDYEYRKYTNAAYAYKVSPDGVISVGQKTGSGIYLSHDDTKLIKPVDFDKVFASISSLGNQHFSDIVINPTTLEISTDGNNRTFSEYVTGIVGSYDFVKKDSATNIYNIESRSVNGTSKIAVEKTDTGHRASIVGGGALGGSVIKRSANSFEDILFLPGSTIAITKIGASGGMGLENGMSLADASGNYLMNSNATYSSERRDAVMWCNKGTNTSISIYFMSVGK